MTLEQPLAGIRIVELAEGIAAPYATKLLAAYGAEVIKVEPPGGDIARRLGPFPDDRVDPEQSALFLHLGANKRSVVADLSTRAGQDRVRRLVAGADAVVESYAPGQLAEWGLGFDDLRQIQPRLVMTSVTPFGQDGPYAGYRGSDVVAYAMGGAMSSTGVDEREPIKLGADLITYQGGNVAATATLAALATVALPANGGQAIHVDVSHFEAQAASIDRRLAFLVGYAYHGGIVRREGTQRLSPAPMGIYPVSDGYVQVITIPAWVPRMLATLNDPTLNELYSDPGWMLNPEVSDATDAVLYPWLLERTREEAMAEAQAHAWPITAVHDTADVVHDPQFVERGFFVEQDHPVAGRFRAPGAPFRLDEAWEQRSPAPLLGEADADESVGAAPLGPGLPVLSPRSGARLPLEGIRVLDFTVVWAGPYLTMLLADLGAEVIRLDNPYLFPSSTKGFAPRLTAEMAKALGPLPGAYPDFEPGARPFNRHAMFTCHSRGRKLATLDMRTDLGRETFLGLVEHSDLIVENNAVKLFEQLRIDWETISARNPRVSLMRLPPMGTSGPYHRHVGFGAHFEALAGLTSLRGYLGADLTSTTSVFHMDPASGMVGAFAAIAALVRRDRTGRGSYVELDQSENMLQHIGELLIDAARTGRSHAPMGNRHRTHAPQGCYRCQGEDRWVVLTVTDDEAWAGLRRAMGDPDWAADARFATEEGRRAHHDEIDEHIGAWTAGLEADDAFHRLQAEGVAAGPVMDEAVAFRDPHLRARGFFRPNVGAETGTHDYPAHLWHWDGPPLRWDPISAMGADNEYVYREVLGLDDAGWKTLDDAGHLSFDYLDANGNPI